MANLYITLAIGLGVSILYGVKVQNCLLTSPVVISIGLALLCSA